MERPKRRRSGGNRDSGRCVAVALKMKLLFFEGLFTDISLDI